LLSGGLNATALAFKNAIATRKPFNKQLISKFFSKRLPPVFLNSVQARKQRGCLRLINCCIGRFYGRCPNPQFLKKLSKLFCFLEDNLELAKFQSPTDTPLNHNFPILKNRTKNFYFSLDLKSALSIIILIKK